MKKEKIKRIDQVLELENMANLKYREIYVNEKHVN